MHKAMNSGGLSGRRVQNHTRKALLQASTHTRSGPTLRPCASKNITEHVTSARNVAIDAQGLSLSSMHLRGGLPPVSGVVGHEADAL